MGRAIRIKGAMMWPSSLGGVAAVGISLVLGLSLSLALLGLAGVSPSLPIMVAALLAGLAGMAWFQGPYRRLFLVLLFLVAPFDVSKAIVPPLERFYSPGLYLSLGHVVLLGLTATWLWEHLWVQKRSLPRTSLDTLALVFLAWVWVSSLSAPTSLAMRIASATTYSLCVLGYYTVSHAIRNTRELGLLLRAVVMGLALEALHVAGQMATHSFLPLPGSKAQQSAGNALSFGGMEASAFRPVGAFDHPNALADYLTLLLAPALALVLMGPSRISRRSWWVSLGVLLLGGALLLLTLSRGGWAAYGLAVIFIGVVFWRGRLIGSTHLLGAFLAAALGLSAIAVAYPQVIWRLTEPDDRSLESRVVLTDQAWTLIRQQPLMGVGFGNYNQAANGVVPPSFANISRDYQEQILKLVVHNHYLLVAAQMGVPALLFWVYLLWRMVRQAWPLHRWQDPGTWALGVGLAGAMASQMIFLASDNYDADIRVFMLWLTAGLLQALTRLSTMPPSGSQP